ncbi:MAG TPA: aldo/keto reductase [Abditibacterium sp.]|jgi:aryl-alcohol dehydrogenase-like predicted oxidoreductase
MPKFSRRELLRLGLGSSVAGTALGAWLLRREAEATQTVSQTAPQIGPRAPKPGVEPKSKALTDAAASPGALPTRLLGQTGQRISIFGLGGASSKTPLSNGPHEQAVAIVERALALGVTYFDTASSYGDGASERAMGEVAKNHRKQMVIASKTGERTYDAAMRELEASLKNLQTDHLDVWLMHHVSLTERDTDPAFGPNGAIKALEKAKAEKMVRFGGVSGHHRTDVLAQWLRRYDFDMVLTVVNAVDRHNPDSFIEKVLPVARARNIGVVAMKIPAYGQLLRPEKGVGMREAFAYSLSQPGVASGIIACDSIAMLEENVAAARAFAAFDKNAQVAIEAKTASYWQEASFYRRWT